jgi:urease accessory protein
MLDRPQQPGTDRGDKAATGVGALPAPLFLWLSPAFPVGAFAYSHGLEWAIECGLIASRKHLEDWIGELFARGSAKNDLVFLSVAHRAAVDGEDQRLIEVAELALALQACAERHLETSQQGNAFMTAIMATWPCAAINKLTKLWEGDVAYPVAVGVAAAGHGLARGAALEAFGLTFAGNLVSAALRLSLFGQTDGQRVLAALAPSIAKAAACAESATLDDIGTAAWMSELCSMRHETQTTRLFRS